MVGETDEFKDGRKAGRQEGRKAERQKGRKAERQKGRRTEKSAGKATKDGTEHEVRSRLKRQTTRKGRAEEKG
jgi:hypothetical protein